MALKIGRLLTAEEQVDHIDNDKSNNDINNLQILTPSENARKDKTKPLIEMTCPNCQQVFRRKRHRFRETWNSVIVIPTCCSRSCSAKYQHKISNKGP